MLFGQRKYDPQGAPVVFPVQRHAAAVLPDGGADAFQVRPLLRQTVRIQCGGGLCIMLAPQHGKATLTVHRHLDEPLFGVRLGAHGGNGVVQRPAHAGW